MEFSEELDTLLEKDYVKDPAFYSDKVFDFLLVNDSILGINPDENIAAAKEKFG
ncbi:hypothetical protein [Pseudoalteromonas ruthenica]|uniref:hypothetical protein n=1 Tax=Pseudoalteromonas ruthenica TaxID=151081 RepID=UPI00241C25D8|nr:hypothetical protein [Pseudoalteromonas ruthenica]